MRSLNLIIIILFISSYPLTSAYAFFDKDIHLLTMQDGLVDNTVTCIYKDEDGFMWFGTNNGLSRYAKESESNRSGSYRRYQDSRIKTCHFRIASPARRYARTEY